MPKTKSITQNTYHCFFTRNKGYVIVKTIEPSVYNNKYVDTIRFYKLFKSSMIDAKNPIITTKDKLERIMHPSGRSAFGDNDVGDDESLNSIGGGAWDTSTDDSSA